jgi:hypothetical protein
MRSITITGQPAGRLALSLAHDGRDDPGAPPRKFLSEINPGVEEAGTRVDILHSMSVMIVYREGNLSERFEGVLEANWARMDGAIRALLDEWS